MNNKRIGAIFCLIAALLESARYITAAIFMSGISSWSQALFEAGLDYVGKTLTVWAAASLVVGIAFLGYGIFKDYHKENDYRKF